MERTTTPDEFSAGIKRLRELRDSGQLTRKWFGYLVWHIWEIRHGRA